MRFISIHLRNYRQYKATDIDFGEKTDNDLHLFIAENGIGKTTLLNAINWCLYEKEAHIGDPEDSEQIFNTTELGRLMNEGEKTGLISVEILAEDNDIKYRFLRKQEVAVENAYHYPTEFTVTVIEKDQSSKVYEKDNANIIVKKFMPETLKQFFFFDGEQLERYFKDVDANEIKRSIHEISKVDLLTSIKQRLEAVISQISRGFKPTAKGEIAHKQECERELQAALQTKSDNEKKISELNLANEDADAEIKKLNDEIAGLEKLPVFTSTLRELDSITIPSCINDKAKIMGDFYTFSLKYKAKISFYPIIIEVLKYIDENIKETEESQQYDKAILEKILSQNPPKCDYCGQTLSPEAISKLKSILDSITLSGKTIEILRKQRSNLRQEITLIESYPEKKQEYLDNYNEINRKLESYENSAEDLRSKIRELSKEGNIEANLVEMNNGKIRDLKDIIVKNNQKIGSLHTSNDQLDKKIEECNRKITQIIKSAENGKQIIRQQEFAESAKSVVADVETEIMNEMKEKMGDKTTQYFFDLVWKKETFEKITFADNYKLSLIKKQNIGNNNKNVLGSVSQGEQALAALSFTLALHEISGFDSLLFIDTPVKNISGDNRSGFAKVLADVSKTKQVILTLIPEEYTYQIRQIFDPIAATKGSLKTIDELETEYIRST